MKNIILIGMPASGKSTAGVLLAKYIGYAFVDSDLLIQQRENLLLCDIIERKGVEKFIEIEESVNSQIDVQKCVIATGGSVVYGKKAMEHLKKTGIVIYLKVGLAELEKRLEGKDIFNRGVVMKKRGETLAELYSERSPLYEKYADITIDCSSLDIERTVLTIIKAVNNYNRLLINF